MPRKYLETDGIIPVGGDISDSDKRIDRWKAERYVYGFDSRETWSLDYSMVVNLFERVLMFNEIAPSQINLGFHKFEWEDQTLTQEEAIDVLLDLCRDYFKADDTFGADATMTARIWNLWAVISPAMWW